MGFLWAQTYIYYCANEPISPHICAVVRAGMFSCLNIIRIIVLEEGEEEDEESGREGGGVVCSMWGGTSSLAKLSSEKERQIERNTIRLFSHPTDLWIISISPPLIVF